MENCIIDLKTIISTFNKINRLFFSSIVQVYNIIELIRTLNITLYFIQY